MSHLEPKVRFVGTEYARVEHSLQTAASRLVRIMDHIAARRYGAESALSVNDIEVTPIVIEGERLVFVNARHVTPAGTTWQPMEADFEFRQDQRDVFMQERDDVWSHQLTTVQALALDNVLRLSEVYEYRASPIERETETP